jgi:hypothetical protein
VLLDELLGDLPWGDVDGFAVFDLAAGFEEVYKGKRGRRGRRRRRRRGRRRGSI